MYKQYFLKKQTFAIMCTNN